MLSLRLFTTAGLAMVLALLTLTAVAQNEAPFTIRRPPDGATVREKVRVEIPLASIPEGGYIAYSIDGTFRVALTPSQEERDKEEEEARKAKRAPMYVFVWDTKAAVKQRGADIAPKDGEHEISATLFVPKGGTATGSTASVAKQTSSVKIKVANKIAATDPGPISLRYKFADGSNREYSRTGESAIVTGLSQGFQGTGDQELVAFKGTLQLAVEDVYPSRSSAMVRNKLTELIVRQAGQEMAYPSEQLPRSLYQELGALGDVKYQNEDRTFDQFAELGIPVDTTINLPRLPLQPVRIGDVWKSRDVPLDIPGTAPDKQPKVELTSTLEGIEWEGGYPTAKIHQTYNSSTGGGAKLKSIMFGSIEVLSPTLTYERDVYIAYRSGTLIKVTRKLEVTGKTASAVSGGGAGPGMQGGGGMGDMGMGMPMGAGIPGGMGAGPRAGGRMGGMAGGPPGDFAGIGSGGMPGGGPGMGYPGGGIRGGRGGGRRGGGGGGMSGGPPGMSGGMGGMKGGGGMAFGGPGGEGGGLGAPMGGGPAGYGGGYGAGGSGQVNSQITLKSTTTTELGKGTKTAGL